MNNRRKIIVGLLALQMLCAAGAAYAQTRVPLITVLIHGTEGAFRARLDAFRSGMRELGYVEDKNYRMQVRWSDNQLDSLPMLARELLQLNPDVAVAIPVLAAQALGSQSKTVPIVLAGGSGALRLGLIASLRRPGGNVTGVTSLTDELTQKNFQILREIAPRAKRVMTLSSGTGASEPDSRQESRAAAKAYGMTLIEAWADSSETLSQLPAICKRERCEALVFLTDPYFVSRRKDLIALATSLRLPATYYLTEFVEDGGLIAYSPDARKVFQRATLYVDKILKGAKPGDLPMEQPTQFDLAVNLKAAKALGIKIPNSILVLATKVIE